MSIDNNFERFFHHSYDKCRDAFLNIVDPLKAKYSSVIHKSLKVPGKTDDNLFIDTVHIKTGQENKNLVIISSGVHGIEGFSGSALQNILLDKLSVDEKIFNDLDFLFIHAVNPWGFKNERRVNENNVDLNRNFGESDKLFLIQNLPYSTLSPILNPLKKLSRNFFSISIFTIKMLFQTLLKTKRFVVEAVGLGQYRFEKGIMFGGFNFQCEKEVLQPILKNAIADYKTVVSVDLHTGLGKKGGLYILNAPMSDNKTRTLANLLFNGNTVPEDDGDFYNEHGSFLDFISSLCSNGQVCIPVMFEFGTINTHTLIGGAKILVNLKDENQGFHYGYRQKKDSERIKKDFKEMLNPPSKEWRTTVSTLFVENFLLIPENINRVDH